MIQKSDRHLKLQDEEECGMHTREVCKAAGIPKIDANEEFFKFVYMRKLYTSSTIQYVAWNTDRSGGLSSLPPIAGAVSYHTSPSLNPNI